MITLHTLENAYDDGNDYRQFARQHLLDSRALASDHTLRSFLTDNVTGALDNQAPRLPELLDAVMETGDIHKLLSYCERVNMRDIPGEDHPSGTRFGEWTFDSLVIEEPTLRELQPNVWAEDDCYPRSDWKREVANGDTQSGYWEWIENQLENDED